MEIYNVLATGPPTADGTNPVALTYPPPLYRLRFTPARRALLARGETIEDGNGVRYRLAR